MADYTRLTLLAENPIISRHLNMYLEGRYRFSDNPYEAMLERLVEALAEHSETLEGFKRHSLKTTKFKTEE